jgi:hypothetical protein
MKMLHAVIFATVTLTVPGANPLVNQIHLYLTSTLVFLAASFELYFKKGEHTCL